jgi:hypothetical protein
MNEIWAALIGAVVGGLITGGVVLRQTRTLLNAETERRKEEREQEMQSVAVALLWEINQFYNVSIRNVNRALRMASPSDLGFYVKPQNMMTFTVFESVAEKVGLFETDLVHSVVGYYGIAKAYMATFEDYRGAMERLQTGQPESKGRAVTLLDQIKNNAKDFLPLTKAITTALAERGKVAYTFNPPWTPEEEQRLSDNKPTTDPLV